MDEELERVTGNNPVNQAMLRGHLYRTGHELVAFWIPNPDGETFSILRECC